MAKTKYNYNDIDFCQRVFNKKHIQKLNKSINGIIRPFYSYILKDKYANVVKEHSPASNDKDLTIKTVGTPGILHAYIMECFKNQTENVNYYVKSNNTSPINYLNAVSLSYYKKYIDEIVYTYNTEQVKDEEHFRYIIQRVSKSIREEALLNGDLSEFIKRDKPLPANITNTMYNKVLTTLKQHKPDTYNVYPFLNVAPKKPVLKSNKTVKVVVSGFGKKETIKGVKVEFEPRPKHRVETTIDKPNKPIAPTVKKSDYNVNRTLFNFDELDNKTSVHNKTFKRSYEKSELLAYIAAAKAQKEYKLNAKESMQQELEELEETIQEYSYEVKTATTIMEKAQIDADYQASKLRKPIVKHDIRLVDRELKKIESQLVEYNDQLNQIEQFEKEELDTPMTHEKQLKN